MKGGEDCSRDGTTVATSTRLQRWLEKAPKFYQQCYKQRKGQQLPWETEAVPGPSTIGIDIETSECCERSDYTQYLSRTVSVSRCRFTYCSRNLHY